MSVKIAAGDTPEKLARQMLGDARLTHELFIPGWHGSGPLPVGQQCYLKDERMGPPTRNWTEPRK